MLSAKPCEEKLKGEGEKKKKKSKVLDAASQVLLPWTVTTLFLNFSRSLILPYSRKANKTIIVIHAV